MVTLKYRLIGSVDYPVLSKSFNTRSECNAWVAANPVLVLEIESSGASAYSRIFG